ncbi:hypothetical protein GIB67_011843 [Kingdonia uniflora]|uniref:SAUR family protein n=1 Tax=Kingdonia uniflora TaxID=39325 RepID=A0A7J7NXL6_9MAGN|nr:hypothetical protein GIB67_011843 [Kingdonia uniflora]
MVSVKKLAAKVKVISSGGSRCPSQQQNEYLLTNKEEYSSSSPKTPTGFVALYVGDVRERFLIPTNFLTHPLFRMLLEKAYNEFGFNQRNGLVVPCSVSAFQEVLNAVECSHRQFELGRFVEEFV